MNIRFVKNNEINFYRWDRCISTSFNGLIYGYSWYLNTVCKTWDAIIDEDYTTIMPLPVSRRLGIEGIKTPCFVNQLGIFSPNLIKAEMVYEFFNSIPAYFKFIDLNINKFNKIETKKLSVTDKSHFEIDLIKPYDKIFKNYTDELKQKLSETKKLSLVKGLQPADFIDFISGSQSTYCIDDDQAKLLRMLVSTSLHYHFGELYGVYDEYNTLISAAFFLWSHNKSILLFEITNDERKNNNALYYLIDRYIYSYSERYFTLSFDFSGHTDISRIYKNFGAIESIFQNVSKHKIPLISYLRKVITK